MPNLIGTLNSIGLKDLTAKLTITLDLPVATEDLAGNDILLLPQTDEYIITDGNLENSTPSLLVQETETVKKSVLIQIFLPLPGVTPVEYSETPVFKVQSIIPNQPETNIADLADTGYTNDTVSTGAYRVAKEMLTNIFLQRIFNANIGYYRGTTPPFNEEINSQDGVLWQDTETLEFYKYDAALNVWLGRIRTAQSNTTNFTTGSNIATIPFNFFRSKLSGSTPRRILLKEYYTEYSVSVAQSNSDYWTVNYNLKNWANAFSAVSGAPTYDTKNKLANTRESFIYLFPNNNTAIYDLNSVAFFGTTFVKTNNAGNINFNTSLTFQSIIEALV